MKGNALTKLLRGYGACREAIVWAKPYSTLKDAWAECPRGDWMLWLAAAAKLCSRKRLVLAGCRCARLALPYVPPGEQRPLMLAIETAERWARGKAPLAEVDAAAYAASRAAFKAAYAAYRAATAYCASRGPARAAANAATDAANAAYYAANAATDAAHAANAAYYAAAALAVYNDAPRQCADLVREILPMMSRRSERKGGR